MHVADAVISDDGTVCRYYHVKSPATEGTEVSAGQSIGKVRFISGTDGTGAHIHMEMRKGGKLVNPLPVLIKNKSQVSTSGTSSPTSTSIFPNSAPWQSESLNSPWSGAESKGDSTYVDKVKIPESKSKDINSIKNPTLSPIAPSMTYDEINSSESSSEDKVISPVVNNVTHAPTYKGGSTNVVVNNYIHTDNAQEEELT
jgi:hypothetical protein